MADTPNHGIPTPDPQGIQQVEIQKVVDGFMAVDGLFTAIYAILATVVDERASSLGSNDDLNALGSDFYLGGWLADVPANVPGNFPYGLVLQFATPTAGGGFQLVADRVSRRLFVRFKSNSVWAPDEQVAVLNSPVFSGVPRAPTANPGTNTDQIASTAFVQAAIAALVNGSPALLDTLQEIATALGNDPNFATTITNELADRLKKNQNLADLLDKALARANLGSDDASNLTKGTLPSARFTDGSHGSRGGGSLHALATTAAHGFMSAADKQRLNLDFARRDVGNTWAGAQQFNGDVNVSSAVSFTWGGSTVLTFNDAAVAETANKLAMRTAAGDLYARLFRTTFPNDGTSNVTALLGRVNNTTDDYARPITLEKVADLLPAATTAAQGMMSAADKSKLNGIQAGADVNPAPLGQSTWNAGAYTGYSIISPAQLAGAVAALAPSPPAQTQGTWNAGASGAESTISPAKLKAAVAAYIPTAFAAVNTYIFTRVNINVGVGSTVSGSQFLPTARSGTWRNMSNDTASNNSGEWLFVRES